MSFVTVNIDRNNRPDRDPVEVSVAERHRIRWVVEGEPGDMVFIVFERRDDGSEEWDVSPFQRDARQRLFHQRGIHILRFEEEGTAEDTTARIKGNPGPKQTEEWKYTIARIKRDGRTYSVNDPMVRVKGE